MTSSPETNRAAACDGSQAQPQDSLENAVNALEEALRAKKAHLHSIRVLLLAELSHAKHAVVASVLSILLFFSLCLSAVGLLMAFVFEVLQYACFSPIIALGFLAFLNVSLLYFLYRHIKKILLNISLRRTMSGIFGSP